MENRWDSWSQTANAQKSLTHELVYQMIYTPEASDGLSYVGKEKNNSQ